MPSFNCVFTCSGTVGNNSTHILYREFPGRVLDAQVVSVNCQTGYWTKADAVGNAVKLQATFTGYVGTGYNATIVVAGYYQGVSGALAASDVKRIKMQEGTKGFEGKLLPMKEINFKMSSTAENPEASIEKIVRMKEEVIDCQMVKIVGHEGANFQVEKYGDKGVMCRGGFIVKKEDKEKLQAVVTALVALKK